MPDQQQYCCIDQEPVSPPYNILGGRIYCARHFAQINKPHPGFWRSAVLMIAAMGVVREIFAFLSGDVQILDRATLIIAELIFAIGPSAAGFVYFYQQDR